jgi:LAS superfamily LD-carboxypeptidase LdcB
MQRNTIFNFVILTALVMFAGCAQHSVENNNSVNKVSEADINTSSAPLSITQPELVSVPKKSQPNKIVVKKDPSKKANKVSLVPEAEAETLNIDELNQKVKANKTREVREILNTNPKALDLVQESDNKLFYVGPNGWRVIDIIEGLRNKRLHEKEIIEHIKAAQLPYKKYSYEEIQVLLKQKIPFKVINTMMTVSK